MSNKIDVWSDKQIQICTEYAKGNDKEVLNLLSNNQDSLGFLESIMKDKLLNDLIRERVISKIEGVNHSCTMHNYDAFDPKTGRYIEVKSEQHSSINGRKYQVTGGGAFGSIEDVASVSKLYLDNPVVFMNAFIDGRLVYNVSFDFKDSKIAERLVDTVHRRNGGAKTAPKFMWSDWCYAKSLKVTYFNNDFYYALYPHASSDLLLHVKSLWLDQQKMIASNNIN